MSSIHESDAVSIQPFFNFDDPRFDPYALNDRDQANLEKTLNILGYIPLISCASGTVRVVISFLSFINSAVKLPLCAIADLFQSTPRGYSYRIEKHLSYMGHSIANMVRGSLEQGLILGNIICYAYDNLLGRIRYPVESKI
jgi:hypothetical protein